MVGSGRSSGDGDGRGVVDLGGLEGLEGLVIKMKIFGPRMKGGFAL